jgi:hypothetical protein
MHQRVSGGHAQGAGEAHVAAEQTALEPEDLVLDPLGARQQPGSGSTT